MKKISWGRHSTDDIFLAFQHTENIFFTLFKQPPPISCCLNQTPRGIDKFTAQNNNTRLGFDLDIC